MNDALQSALAGEPVMVTLGGKEYPLAFPMQAVILYKRETAALDRERKRATGAPTLTREAKRELRDRRAKLVADAEAQRPANGDGWDDEKFALFQEMLAEARAIKVTFDEDAAAGDSLYDKSNWWKISPEGDPERLLLVLWVGLHRRVGEARIYSSPLSREELGLLINLGNGAELTTAIAKALSAHLIAPTEDDDEEEEASPNAQPAAAEILPGTIINPQK